MASKVGPQAQKDDHGLFQAVCLHAQVFNPHHDIVLLVGLRVASDKIKVTKILFGRF